VVISTATKSLQEQLYQKDVPFLQKYFAPNLRVAVMKGRSNFLCKAKLHQMADQPVLRGMERDGCVPADSRLEQIHGNGRPGGANVF